MKQIFKKVFMSIVIIIVIFTLIACSNSINKSDNNASAGKSLPDKLDNPNVTILTWTDIVKAEFDEATKIFEEKYGGKVNHVMGTWEQLETMIVAALASGDSPDVVYWNQQHMPRYAIKGLVQPLDDYIDFKDPVIDKGNNTNDLFTYKGKHYGVSEGPAPFFTYYNKTMFENNGVKTPADYYKEGNWNWETMRQLAIQLTADTDRDGQVDQWGLSTEGGGGTSVFYLSNDVDLFNIKDDGTIDWQLLDSRVVEGLQFYQDTIIKDKITPAGGNPLDLFVMGKAAMHISRAHIGNARLVPEMKDEWDITSIPFGPANKRGVSPAACGYWAIASGSKNPKGAAVMIYLRMKTHDKQEEAYTAFTEAQAELARKLSKKVIIACHGGLGIQQSYINQNIWNSLRKGETPVNIIEKITPVFQGEIDRVLNE